MICPQSTVLSYTSVYSISVKMSNSHEEGSGGLPPPRIVLYPPEKVKLEWPRMMRIGAGLHNMGNTCFLNSTLQCLTYTAPLVNYLLTDDHSNKCKRFTVDYCEKEKTVD